MLLLSVVLVIKTDKIIILNLQDDSMIESSLENRLGDKYYSMYDYKYVKIPSTNYYVIAPSIMSSRGIEIPDIEGTKEEILQRTIDYVKRYDYTKFTSNPKLMVLQGEGNCQALSLTFKTILDKYDIPSELIGTGDHVYNKVALGDKIYIIDFSNGSVEVKE